jgi:hypothetical protein
MTEREELIQLICACLLSQDDHIRRNSIGHARSLQIDLNKQLDYEKRRKENEDSINYEI